LSSPAPGAEEEIQNLFLAYQQYQAQAEALVRQISLAQLTMEGLDRAATAVDAMEKAAPGQEMLVPIGAGSFIHARLASSAKVISSVGAGVSIEKDASQARESLSARKGEVSEGYRKLNEALSKVDQEMQKIQAVLSKYESQSHLGSERVV
jgi:prefoldin alpha subunit